MSGGGEARSHGIGTILDDGPWTAAQIVAVCRHVAPPVERGGRRPNGVSRTGPHKVSASAASPSSRRRASPKLHAQSKRPEQTPERPSMTRTSIPRRTALMAGLAAAAAVALPARRALAAYPERSIRWIVARSTISLGLHRAAVTRRNP